MYEKLTKCPNFSSYLPEIFPQIGGRASTPCCLLPAYRTDCWSRSPAAVGLLLYGVTGSVPRSTCQLDVTSATSGDELLNELKRGTIGVARGGQGDQKF